MICGELIVTILRMFIVSLSRFASGGEAGWSGNHTSGAAASTSGRVPSDRVSTLRNMSKKPSRIELLELDIDLRLADLWREAADIDEWNLDVVAAFMRAAYGKGYCDALTEESPGSLCADHGYRVPERKLTRADA